MSKICVLYQKLTPYKGSGVVSMPICVNRRETAQPVPPRPFYSQLRQLPCLLHVMTIPTHLLLSHLLLLAQNLSRSKQMLSKLHDGYTCSSVVKGLTCKCACHIVVACTLFLNKARLGGFIDFQHFLSVSLPPLPPSLSLPLPSHTRYSDREHPQKQLTL